MAFEQHTADENSQRLETLKNLSLHNEAGGMTRPPLPPLPPKHSLNLWETLNHKNSIYSYFNFYVPLWKKV